VFTKLNALDGTGLPGREVMYVSGAARPQAASKDLKGGDYETLFVTNSGDVCAGGGRGRRACERQPPAARHRAAI
jgi:hypothetical protein